METVAVPKGKVPAADASAACGRQPETGDEIVIQGDVKDDLFDILPEKWPEIDEDLIDDIGEKKRS